MSIFKNFKLYLLVLFASTLFTSESAQVVKTNKIGALFSDALSTKVESIPLSQNELDVADCNDSNFVVIKNSSELQRAKDLFINFLSFDFKEKKDKIVTPAHLISAVLSISIQDDSLRVELRKIASGEQFWNILCFDQRIDQSFRLWFQENIDKAFFIETWDVALIIYYVLEYIDNEGEKEYKKFFDKHFYPKMTALHEAALVIRLYAIKYKNQFLSLLRGNSTLFDDIVSFLATYSVPPSRGFFGGTSSLIILTKLSSIVGEVCTTLGIGPLPATDFNKAIKLKARLDKLIEPKDMIVAS